MPDPLQSLIGALKSERCPPSVPDRVARRIALGARAWPRALSWRLGRTAWAGLGVTLALAAVLGLGSIRHWSVRKPEPAPIAATLPSQSDRALVVEQTQVALALVGRILLDAGTRTEAVLMKEAVPPLVDGFLSAKQKLNPSL